MTTKVYIKEFLCLVFIVAVLGLLLLSIPYVSAASISGYSRSPSGTTVDPPVTLTHTGVSYTGCENTYACQWAINYDDGSIVYTELATCAGDSVDFSTPGNATSVSFVFKDVPNGDCWDVVETGSPAFTITGAAAETTTASTTDAIYELGLHAQLGIALFVFFISALYTAKLWK